jgi:hypothetical protein
MTKFLEKLLRCPKRNPTTGKQCIHRRWHRGEHLAVEYFTPLTEQQARRLGVSMSEGDLELGQAARLLEFLEEQKKEAHERHQNLGFVASGNGAHQIERTSERSPGAKVGP